MATSVVTLPFDVFSVLILPVITLAKVIFARYSVTLSSTKPAIFAFETFNVTNVATLPLIVSILPVVMLAVVLFSLVVVVSATLTVVPVNVVILPVVLFN